MSAETEAILERVKQTTNVTGKRGKLIQKQTRFLKVKERRQREEERDWINGVLSQPPWAIKDMTGEQREGLRRRANYLEEDLEEHSPPTDISGETKDALYKYQKELEEKIRQGMPTRETMRRNPPGAVDAHMRWEKTNLPLIITWKNVKRLLDPDNDEKDYTNIEMLRPSGLSPEALASTYMVNAQIPGVFGMTPLAKANWPENMPEYGTTDSPMKQMERRDIVEGMVAEGMVSADRVAALEAEIKKLQAQVQQHAKAGPQRRGRRTWTAEEKEAARQRMIERQKKTEAARIARQQGTEAGQ